MLSHAGFRTDLPVHGRPVLVVGSGATAMGPVDGLRHAGAEILVVGQETTPTLDDLAQRGLITWHRRDFHPSDLDAVWLVVAATGSAETDRTVSAEAERRQLFCLSSSNSDACGNSEPGGNSEACGNSEARREHESVGTVTLVGGGPGDPGLLTVAGQQELSTADVILTDRLAPVAALRDARPDALIIDVSKVPRGAFTPQEQINALLVEHALAGRHVVRLKGGDGFVFGRGGEEWQACAAAGIPVRVIPGVSSAIGVPALAGIPVTHRTLNQGFTVVSGHVPPGDPRSMLDWPALARAGTALVILMGIANLEPIAAALIAAGLDADTAAATIADGGLTSQRVVRAPLSLIASATAQAGLGAPAVIVIGSIAGFDPDSG